MCNVQKNGVGHGFNECDVKKKWCDAQFIECDVRKNGMVYRFLSAIFVEWWGLKSYEKMVCARF